MTDAVKFSTQPSAKEMYMLAGWRQWADAGSISSGLPQYLIQQTGAQKIGTIQPDGFYLFQIPGTHDLVRPVVKFDEGYPQSLDGQRNEIYFAGNDERGIVIFLGDEPHLDIERYAQAFLSIAKALKVKRIVSFGGVYGELPYDKERMVSSMYSLQHMKDEISRLSVNLSDYQGGASIGSYICRRAGEQNLEYVGLYAFVPTYDLSGFTQLGNTIRIENDFMAWLGVMRRVIYMLKIDVDLTDLKKKCDQLLRVVNDKVDELDSISPQLGVREYMNKLSEEFTEVTFDPLGDVWEKELRRLFDDSEPSE